MELRILLGKIILTANNFKNIQNLNQIFLEKLKKSKKKK